MKKEVEENFNLNALQGPVQIIQTNVQSVYNECHLCILNTKIIFYFQNNVIYSLVNLWFSKYIVLSPNVKSLIGCSVYVTDFLVKFSKPLYHRSNTFQDFPVWKVKVGSFLEGPNLISSSSLIPALWISLLTFHLC